MRAGSRAHPVRLAREGGIGIDRWPRSTWVATALLVAASCDGGDGTPARSSDADLAELSVSAGALAPAFDPAATSYTVESSVASATLVTARARDGNAMLEINGVSTPSGTPFGPVPLLVDLNTIDVVVTAEDGTTKVYSVVVRRALGSPPEVSPAIPPASSATNPTPSTIAGPASSTSANLALATQYWFRGVPQSEEPVGQADATITVPLRNGDSLAFTTWGNGQLSNSTGDAAFPDSTGGEFTEIDVTGTYARKIGAATVFGGVISYNFPNVGPSTQELMGGVTFGSADQEISHTLTLFYDYDLADDFYLTYGVGHVEALDDRFTLAISGLVGFMGEGQSELYFGVDHSGLSDVSVTGLLNYQHDEFTTMYAKLTAVAVPDSALREAEEDRDFRASTVVLMIGVGWSL